MFKCTQGLTARLVFDVTRFVEQYGGTYKYDVCHLFQYCGINIGPVHKRDIMKASVMLEHNDQ